MKSLTYQEALVEAIREEMDADESIIHLGQNIGPELGGAKWSCRGLEKFAEKGRLLDTPISESAMTGAGIGAAAMGLRPIVQIMYLEFMGLTITPLITDGAPIWFKSDGKVKVPMVIRTLFGMQYHHAGHCEDFSGWLTGMPGLKVVLPATPYDAKGLMKAAIRDDNPVVMMEHAHLMHGERQEVPDEEYVIPLGKADVKRQGDDVTLVAAGYMTKTCLEAADALADKGVSVEVVDLRTISPIDRETVAASVGKTGRVAVVSESWKSSGYGAETAAIVAEELGGSLKSNLVRIAPPDAPMPFSLPLMKLFVPHVERIVETVEKMF